VGLWVFETVPSQKPRIPGSLADPRSLGQSGDFGNVAEAGTVPILRFLTLAVGPN